MALMAVYGWRLEGSRREGTGLRCLFFGVSLRGFPIENDARNLDHRESAARRMIETEAPMRIERFSFGHITIDGVTYDHDVVIDHGKVRKRVKKPSKKLRDAYAHTPLSAAEEI